MPVGISLVQWEWLGGTGTGCGSSCSLKPPSPSISSVSPHSIYILFIQFILTSVTPTVKYTSAHLLSFNTSKWDGSAATAMRPRPIMRYSTPSPSYSSRILELTVHQYQNTPDEHKAKISHELIGGAAAYEVNPFSYSSLNSC